MKQTMTGFLAIAGLVLGAQQAAALPIAAPSYQDIDMYQRVNTAGATVLGAVLNNANPSLTGIFDIRYADSTPSATIVGGPAGANAYMNAGTTFNDIVGFEPQGAEIILSASAYFYLRNATDDNDEVSIYELDFTSSDLLTRGDGTRIILTGTLGELSLGFLYNNGYLEYTVERAVSSTPGVPQNVLLEYAQLQVMAGPGGPDPSSVPDGGSTAGLLAGALLAVGTVARRLKA